MKATRLWIALGAGLFLLAAGYAMRGEHGPTGHVGLLGTSEAGVSGAGPSRGLLGIATGVGVQGQGDSYGVLGAGNGTASSATGIAGVIPTAGGLGTAVYGSAPSTGWAGYFDGDLAVAGTLVKSAGSFRIDHPLDPQNKYLSHSFVESPDMMNLYSGNATLDGDGTAVVELPAWFEALNRDFRYQLTCIGESAPVYVAEEIARNRFKIAGGHGSMKVSWQVTGSRKDPYAMANPIPLESWKPAHERGRFLHPEVYGLPAAASIGHDRQRAIAGAVRTR